MVDCVVLVVGAGRGRRFGGDLPKQYCTLGGEPLLRRTLRAFTGHPRVGAVRPVIHPDDRDLFDAAAEGLGILEPVPGGASRQDSVRLGLESLEDMAPRLVLIHDAARPFVDAAMVGRVIDALADTPGAIPALPVVDTLKRGGDGRIGETVDRAGLWRAQTPQGFRFAEILAAYRSVGSQPEDQRAALTDDAAVAQIAGHGVRLVTGAAESFKITTAADLSRARRWLAGGTDGDDMKESQAMEFRCGNGFDVHRFGPGDAVMLCGVRIPHDAGLIGHSDADVGLHALTDALLGALAAGDIGQHFPPLEPRWKNADSSLFLRHAADMLRERGGRFIHADVTVICERPKIGPHRDAMAQRIAEVLRTEPNRINIKATTTERLGFTGRGEGLAAQAAATIALPRSAAPADSRQSDLLQPETPVKP